MNVAHDLKEPLRNTASCARMLATQLDSADAQSQQFAQWLMDSADRMQELIDALFEHARHGGEGCSAVDLESMVDDINSDLRCLRNRTGGKVIHRGLPTIHAGPLGMRVVLGNLIENALKYGRPHVPPVVSVTGSDIVDGWELRVSDNGVGMTEAQVKQVFEPFKRFSRQVDGLGMGLSHVWKIVEEHRGRVHIESVPDQGTTFVIRLPKFQ